MTGFDDGKLGYKEDIGWNEWKSHYDPETEKTIYEKVLNIKIPSFTSALVPNFQSCYLSRFYELEFKIELKPQSQVPNINKFKRTLMKIQAIRGSNTYNTNTDPVESNINYNSFFSKGLCPNKYLFSLKVPILNVRADLHIPFRKENS